MDIFETWIAKKKIANRGLFNTDTCPENSLPAFEKAIENGHAILLDVRMLDDGTPIVFHDETLGRMTNLDGYVSTFKKDDIAGIKLLKSNEHIPTFQEALDFIACRTPILIEINNFNTSIGQLERSIVEILNNYNGDYAIQSFNPCVLEYFKNTAPHIFRGQVAGKVSKTVNVGIFKRMALANMRYNKHISCPHFIAYNLHDLPNPIVAKYRKKIPVIAWTVRCNDEYERVKSFVDNVIFEKKPPVDNVTEKDRNIK